MRLIRGRRAICVGATAGVLAAGLLTASAADATTYTWSVSLSGAAQTASGIQGDPDGTGSATITGDTATNRICATVTWLNIASPVVAGHIHQALPNQPENPAFTLNLFGPDLSGAPDPVSACNPAPGPVLTEMAEFPEAFAVVVHNEQYPLGAIRGQLRGGGLTGIECDLKLRCP
jgi:hypothetical protein